MAFQLNQKKIPETYALKGGTQGWKSAGYPMEGGGTVTAPPAIIKDGAPMPPGTSSNGQAPPNY